MVYHVRYLIETKNLFMQCIGIDKSIVSTAQAEILNRQFTVISLAYLQAAAFLTECLAATITTDDGHVLRAVFT